MENKGVNGKYTTTITNVYLRESGKKSVKGTNSGSQNIVKLVFDKVGANAGSGAVIDTSYPGTLLNVAMQRSLKNEWYIMTGRPYLNVPISLSEEEMISLPTILLQLKTAFPADKNTNLKTVVGMVGYELDPVRLFPLL